MGTSAPYKGPNWPKSSDAVNDAASAGHPTPTAVGAAVRAFARDYAASSASSSGGGGLGGGRTPSGGGGGGSAGGSRGRAGRTGARLGKFLGTAQQHGLREALKQFNLEEYRDATLEDLCDALLDALTDPDGLLEDTALREAMDRTLEELCKNAMTADELEAILTGKGMNVTMVVATYYCHVLAMNFEVKEFSRIRERTNDRTRSRAFLDRARDYIRGFVEYKLSKQIDLTKYNLNSRAAVQMADRLNQEVIEALGGDE